jgi:hypothetical protein
MSYASLDDLTALLPENITIGDVVGPSVVSPRRSTIATKVAERHLLFAIQHVDASLSSIYVTPLRRVIVERSPIVHNMLPSSTDVMVADVTGFRVGECVRLSDTNGSEISRIAAIPTTFDDGGGPICNTRHLTLASPTLNAYDSGSSAVIEMLVYPEPVTKMTASFALSFIYDKLFTTDGSPDVSNFGKTMRNNSREMLEDIITGVTRLKGQQYVGRRFVRQQLFDGVKTPVEYSRGQSKE